MPDKAVPSKEITLAEASPVASVAIAYEYKPEEEIEATRKIYADVIKPIVRKTTVEYTDKVYPITVKPTSDNAKEDTRIKTRAALASAILPNIAPVVVDGVTPLDVDGGKNVTTLSVGDLSFFKGAHILLTTDGKSRISRISAANVNLNNLTVDFLPGQVLTPGVYTVIAGRTMTGTAIPGVPPVGLSFTSLRIVGANLVATLISSSPG